MKHIKLFEEFINEAVINLNDVKKYLEDNLGLEYQDENQDFVEFFSDEYSANVEVYKNGNVEIHSGASKSFIRKIKKVEDLYQIYTKFGQWYDKNY